MKEWRRMASSS